MELQEQQKWPNPARVDPQSNLIYKKVTGMPTDISILSTRATLLNEDGSPADISSGVYNHHINFADANKVPFALTACPGAAPVHIFGLSFFGGVSEDKTTYTYTTKDSELDSGFYFGKDHNILFTAELINYTNATKNVYIVLDMQYVPGQAKMDSSFESLSVTQCDGFAPTIALPASKKQFHMTSKDMVIQQDGYIVSARKYSCSVSILASS
jgi:hypothetical protein